MSNTNPSSPPQFTALAERCEQATGPSWSIDEAIANALGWYCRKETGLGMNGRTPGRTVWRRPDHVKAPLPKFSKSLDAAMTLVPEGWEAIRQEQVRMTDGSIRCWASVGPVDAAMTKRCATPALALCAAALRAKDQS